MTNDFYPWLKQRKILRRLWKFAAPLSVGVTVTKLEAIRAHLPWKLSEYDYSSTALIAITEAVVLGFLSIFFLTPDHISINKARRPEASDGVERFRFVWQLLWIVWSVLYAFVAFDEIAKFQDEKWFRDYAVWFSLIIDTFNNINTLLLVICFLTMHEASYVQEEGHEFGQVYRRYLPVMCLAIVAFLVPEAICAKFVDSDTERTIIQPILSSLAGVAGGAALCIVISRFESKFASPPKELILLLYCYAVIQPLIGAWPMSPTVELVSISLWFVLKLVLFVLAYWFLASGRALFYFDRIQNLNKVVSDEWEMFYLDYVLDSGDEGERIVEEQNPRTGDSGDTDRKDSHVDIAEGDGGQPTPEIRKGGIEWDVFLSAPMASLGGASASSRTEFEAHVTKIKKILESRGLRVYRADSQPGESLPEKALGEDSNAIGQSQMFLMLWYQTVASSALFECGIAYERKIPILILSDQRSKLPFLLRKLDKVVPQANLCEVALEDVSAWLGNNWDALTNRTAAVADERTSSSSIIDPNDIDGTG